MQKRPEDGGEDRKREDRRVRRTRASIRRAFLDLLDEKSYGQITVTELSESAFDCCVSLERLSLPPGLTVHRNEDWAAYGDFTWYNGDNGTTSLTPADEKWPDG